MSELNIRLPSISWNCRGKLFTFHEPIIMGIVNLTPDSFYDGGNWSENNVVHHVQKLISDGATIIDIGGASSKPGSMIISPEDEWNRIHKSLKLIRQQFPNIILSLDTYHSSTAKKGYDLGIDIINDISAGEIDKNMFSFVAKEKIPYIMMHMKGTPVNMQTNTKYENMVGEISTYFSKKINKLIELGHTDIVLDLGFGFSKTLDQNYELLRCIKSIKAIFNFPLLVGLSRKSMLYKLLEIEPNKALNATTSANMIALINGANILRVHDVKEAKECIQIYKKYIS